MKVSIVNWFTYAILTMVGMMIIILLFIDPVRAFLYLPISYASFTYAWALFSCDNAQYTIHIDGIRVKFPFRKMKLYPWDEFQQVCVCYAHYTTRGPLKAMPAICCIKKGEKLDWQERWKTENPYRYRTVICVKYTPELHKEIIAKCPMEIVDLRNTRAYPSPESLY